MQSSIAWVFFALHTIWIVLLTTAVRSGVMRGEMDAAFIWYFQFYIDLPVSVFLDQFQQLFCMLLKISGNNPDNLSWLMTHNVPYTFYALIIGGCQYYMFGYIIHVVIKQWGRMKASGVTHIRPLSNAKKP